VRSAVGRVSRLVPLLESAVHTIFTPPDVIAMPSLLVLFLFDTQTVISKTPERCAAKIDQLYLPSTVVDKRKLYNRKEIISNQIISEV